MSDLTTPILRFHNWPKNLANDAALTNALLERLLYHARVSQIRGDSYRLEEKPRSGLMRHVTQLDDGL